MEEFVLGDYIFSGKKIGKGAFSVIYKGTHKVTDNVFAIKEISYENLNKIKNTIKREFTVMKKLNHPNIIKLHEVFFDSENKNVYLVLDYYKRGDLYNFLKGKPLKEKYAKKYMRQLASGLKYLHENNIIHRDLKLKNILVTDSNDIVISDFGFARDGDSNTMFDTLCGSPMYMAPEIMTHKSYDNKSDLWSVGVIMYELLFGTTPYHAKNMIQLMKKIKKRDVIIPEEYSELISDECKELLLSLLHRNPRRRINWDNFFTHKWFEKDEILEGENRLMDINMGTNSLTTASLSKYSLRSSTQFLNSKVFKHNSIRKDSSSELYKEPPPNTESEDTQFKMSIEERVPVTIPENDTDSETEYHELEIEMSSNENNGSNESNVSDVSDVSDGSDGSDGSDVEDNENDLDINGESVYYDSYEQISRVTSKPINIEKSNMFYSNKNDYHLIKSTEYKYMSEPPDIEGLNNNNNNSLSNSLRSYLFNSIDFLRHSYYYISRKTI